MGETSIYYYRVILDLKLGIFSIKVKYFSNKLYLNYT